MCIRDRFHIDLGGNSCYNDSLWYEGWEGNYDLVKLNLRKDAVVEHLLEAIRFWVQEFGIDGLRPVSYTHLDVYKRQLQLFAFRLLFLLCGSKQNYAPGSSRISEAFWFSRSARFCFHSSSEGCFQWAAYWSHLAHKCSTDSGDCRSVE